MTKFARGRFFIAIPVMLTSAVFTVGCASIQKVDAFSTAQEKAGIFYAQVNKISPASTTYQRACENKDQLPLEYQKLYCHRLSEFKAVELGVLSNGVFFIRNELVPNSAEIQAGSIVKLDVTRTKGDYFAGVASLQETPDCYWEGNPNNRLDNALKTSGKVVGGFLVGAFAPVPSALGLTLSRNISGGVECHGWSYKDAFYDFLNG